MLIMNILNRFCASTLFLLSIAPIANSAICDYGQNAGVVKRVYPTFANGAGIISGTYFTISGTTSALTSPTGYYFIPNYDNYHEMHDLVLEAAKAQWKVQIKTTNCGNPAANANVQYLVVDF
jgi:hypothetical protein